MNKVTNKVEKQMVAGTKTMPCVGSHCCTGSTCMNLPGLRCSSDRGPTSCVGASTFPPKKGMCGCLAGACSPEGTCSSKGLPDSFEPQPTAQALQQPAQPAQAQQQQRQQAQVTVPSAQAAAAPAPAPAAQAATAAATH